MAKILFIEDDLRWQTLLKEILETAGHTLDGASSFEVAMVKLEKFDFDILVFDYG